MDSPRGSNALMGSVACLAFALGLPFLLGHLSQRLMVWSLFVLFLGLALLGPPPPQSQTPRILEDNPVAAFLRQRYEAWEEVPPDEPHEEPSKGSDDSPAP